MQGIKYDDGKAPMNLLDRHALEQVANVLAHGAVKYAPENWRGGISYSRLIAASLRHLMAVSDGEDYDQESQLPHAAHAMCSLMFLLWMMRNRPDLDDRWRAEAIPVEVHDDVFARMENDMRTVLDSPDTEGSK
jgi:hypothetical protein